MIFDFTRQKMNLETIELLYDYCKQVNLFKKIKGMQMGEMINITERRSVLHHALRMPRTESLIVNGVDVVK